MAVGQRLLSSNPEGVPNGKPNIFLSRASQPAKIAFQRSGVTGLNAIDQLALHVSAWNRKRKYAQFIQMMHPTAESQIIDVGVNVVEHSRVDNFLEQAYLHPENITAISVDDAPAEFKRRYQKVSVIKADGRHLPFPDNTFDIGYSNAVIEHVGSAVDQKQFLAELLRVSRRGYITTPNRYFPVEVHTRVPLLHFLPKRYFDRLLHMIGRGWAAGGYMNLLGKRQLKGLLHEAGITDYRIHKNRILFFTVTFTVIWENHR